MVLTHSRIYIYIYIYTVYNYMYIIILIMYSTCFFTKSKLFIISGDLGTAASLRSEEGKPCWRTGTRRSPCAVWRPRENPWWLLVGLGWTWGYDMDMFSSPSWVSFSGMRLPAASPKDFTVRKIEVFSWKLGTEVPTGWCLKFFSSWVQTG